MPCKAIRFALFQRRPRAGREAATALAILLALMFLPQCIVAAAQSQVRGRVVTRDEGQAIVDAISERQPLRGGRRAKPDCSHLVNDVYNVAGFPYAYAKSADLYRGHENFVRVKSAQPGDLIVWRGHVGLVTDPREHLFYSSLRSGLDVEDYTSAYWTKHGTPRFYRYRITNDEPYLLARGATSDRAADARFRTLPVKQSTRDEESEASSGDESADTPVRSSGNRVGLSDSATPGASSNIPPAIFVSAGRDKPTIQQVNEAIHRTTQSLEGTIEAESLLRSSSTVTIFTELRVARLNFKDNRGWAYIQVDSSAYLHDGELDKTSHHVEEHWEMARTKSGWKVSMPPGTIYLSRSDATRIFAQQLALLTEKRESERSNSAASEESHLASLLNGLLNN